MSAHPDIDAVLAGSKRWHVELGDCRELLKVLPDNCIDAIVTDLPYEIGFMGRSWDRTGLAFDVAMWSEALRVLKPGAHAFSFGGTKTYHRMACAMEDAGFEFRDQIDWIYAQGMPKGTNISKAIDKAAGAKRRVVGQRTLTGNAAQTTKEKGGTYASGTDSRGVPPKIVDVTEPATDAAKQWDDWRTGLKPGHEPIAMAMKPLEGTFHANVLKWGTGAINVGATRVGGATGKGHWSRDDGSDQTSKPGYDGGFEGGGARATDGRWPANLAFSHGPDCELVGTRKVKAAPPWNENRPPSLFTGADTSPVHHTDSDGFETLEDWRCAEGCPVGMLDGQSGHEVSRTGASSAGIGYGGISVATPREQPRYGDAGGASRYFTTFPYEPFFYEPKANGAERELGCEHLPDEVVDDGRHTPNDTPYQRGKTKRKNTHTTVKPVRIIRYLSRLSCRPGGLILDLTAGSGTGGIAALAEGFRWLGFELLPKHVEIAIARIIGDAPLLNMMGGMR